MTRHPLLVLLLACLLATSGCSDAAKEVQDTIAAPSPSPSPTPPPPEPVEGAVTVEVVDASARLTLGFADDGPPPKGSVKAAAAAVGDALDQFLDDAQRGKADLRVIGARWLVRADPEAAEALRTGLTNPDNPVKTAGYLVTVQVEPSPSLAATVATVQRRDGTAVEIELVFDVSGEQPLVQLVGGGENL